MYRRKYPWQAIFLVTFLIMMTFIHLSNCQQQCIDSKIGKTCIRNQDCYKFKEMHLYCNRTQGANVCAFQIESYTDQVISNKDCQGAEYSAEVWSNPISNTMLDGSLGIDCIRWCYLTETCFVAVIVDNQCFLKNDKCFSNLRARQGALLGVMSVVREDYRCGCAYPFRRRRENKDIVEWMPDCPESTMERNPYRCCSPKGLCIPCSS